MIKKIGISMLLALAMLAASLNISGQATAYANRLPQNLSEIRERQRETRDNIAEIDVELEVVGAEIAELREKIDQLQIEIDDLEASIDVLKNQISNLEEEIRLLGEEIDSTLAYIEIVERDIDLLLEKISLRLRATQHRINTNSFFTILIEAESLVDFVRELRWINRIAQTDANLMNELDELIEIQEALFLQLKEKRDGVNERVEELRLSRATLEAEQNELEIAQAELIRNQETLQDRLDDLNQSRLDEEAILAELARMEDILTRTPPPAAPGSGAATGGVPQTPNESGLAHPMPGGHVTSNFGPRWGGHHAGVDIVVRGNNRAPILAAAAGTVTTAGWNNGGMGFYVIISHNINGQRVDTLYGHLAYNPMVSVGDVVHQGQQIGNKGNTGNSFGDHLHFEVHPGGFSWGANRGVDPRHWVAL